MHSSVIMIICLEKLVHLLRLSLHLLLQTTSMPEARQSQLSELTAQLSALRFQVSPIAPSGPQAFYGARLSNNNRNNNNNNHGNRNNSRGASEEGKAFAYGCMLVIEVSGLTIKPYAFEHTGVCLLQTLLSKPYGCMPRSIKSYGIIHRRSCPHISEQNNFVEHHNRRVMETGHTLLAQASVSQRFWHYAFDTAVYLINRMPSRKSTNKVLMRTVMHQKGLINFLMGMPWHSDEGLESTGKNLVAIVRDVYVFVGSFTYITDFVVLEDIGEFILEDIVEVVTGKPFRRVTKYDCAKGLMSFTRIFDNYTFQFPHTIPRFRNAYEKNKFMYKNCLNLGPEYQVDKSMKEWLIRGHVSLHEVTQLPNDRDVTRWRDFNGTFSEFSVKRAWVAFRPRGTEVPWHRIVWFPHCVPCHAFHVWLVMRNSLKTQDKLKQWDVGINTDLNLLRCALCDTQPDSSSRVWKMVRHLADMDSIQPSLHDIISYLQPIANTRTVRSIVGILNSSMASILVNGSPTKEFQFHRGL
ncbi:homeodomain-like protein, partial [Tanacetum coccineum]